MPSLFDRVSRFARSSQGKRAMREAQRLARDPKTKRKITQLRNRYASRGRAR